MPQLAPHIQDVPASGIRAIHELALQLDDVIMLAVGEPDRDAAPHIKTAAKTAWDDNQTHYAPNAGILPLREAIRTKLGHSVQLDQIWVTLGATQALHQAMSLTLAPGDDVLVPDPGYTTFTLNARMLGATPVPYALLPEHGFLPDLAQLESLITERTRVLIVNSPSNPLGVVFPRETLLRLVDFAERHDLWIISDEVYEAFTYGAEHVSLGSLSSDRVFGVHSFSKTYAMTGVRVGYLVTPPGFNETMRRVQEAAISCVGTADQFAALAAIEGPQDDVGRASEHYRSNYEAAVAVLDSLGIHHHVPRGAFYLWIDMTHATKGDVASWAQRFLLEQRVAVAPGSAFGASGEGWIRVCLAASEADIVTGLGRLPRPIGG